MLKTYRIIPFIFILFLFGFTLITVSPVIAEDSAAFVECQQIKPRGKFRPMKQKKNCFRNLARALQDQSGDSVQAVVPVETSGSEVAELNVTIAALQSQVATLSGQHVELQSQVATLTTTNAQLQEPLNAKIAELETQLSVANAAQEPLNAKMAELETQVSAANAAFLGCSKINPEGYGTGLSRAVGGKDHATYVKAMKKQRDCFMSAAGL